MKMAVGSDHGGFALKEMLKSFLIEQGIQVQDEGCHDNNSCDYPDFARAVAGKVSDGLVDEGILICTTGIGMSIMANKFPRVRAALCVTPRMAKMAKAHNNANVLALGAEIIEPDQAKEILKEWLASTFDCSERHRRRVSKIHEYACGAADPVSVYDRDPEIYAVLKNEEKRQRDSIDLIASENYVSRAVREASGSALTNKYAEGFPGNRWYDGCKYADEAESMAVERAMRLFGAEHANVQPHSGSSANMAVYFAALRPGDTILAMSLKHGGHLTHGLKANFSGRLFNIAHYGVNPETEQIDYDQVAAMAREHKPKMIVAGASAYSRIIDFKQFRQIADSVSALLLVDMAHIAGLVAANCHPNPVPYADFVTATTHKTLRGPRGGMILCGKKSAREIDRQIFPGLQGGPLMHIIAAKAVCFLEAAQPEFATYQNQVIRNAQCLAETLKNRGMRIVSGGTDNHLLLVDLTPINVTGKAAASALDAVGITVNKNSIPFDTQIPAVTSGIRIGSAAATTRGMKETEMRLIAELMADAMKNIGNAKKQEGIRAAVLGLSAKFPIP